MHVAGHPSTMDSGTANDSSHTWQKGVPHPTTSRINHWSLNGHGQPVFTGGLYTPAEIATLTAAVTSYCDAHSVTPATLCSERHDKLVRGAWAEISRALPHRTVLSVYRRSLRQFAPHAVAGKWTDEEVAHLSNLVEVHGYKWKAIQTELGRSAHSCRSKYFDVTAHGFEKKGRWSSCKIELLLRAVREALGIDAPYDVRQINEYTLNNDVKIPWTVVSFKVMRGRVDCYVKWRQMTRRSNEIAASMGLEAVPMARCTLKFDVKMEYHQWKAERDWRRKNADDRMLGDDANDDNGQAKLKLTQIQMEDSLLAKIVQSKANRPSEMSWHTVRDMPDGTSPRERFEELCDEYAPNDSLDLPLCELAKIVRDRFNKFVLAAGEDGEGLDGSKTTSKRKKKKSTRCQQVQSNAASNNNSNNNIGDNATESIDTEILGDRIKNILATANRDEITVKDIRKLLEKQLGVKLGKYKDQIKEMVVDML